MGRFLRELGEEVVAATRRAWYRGYKTQINDGKIYLPGVRTGCDWRTFEVILVERDIYMYIYIYVYIYIYICVCACMHMYVSA